MGYPPQTDQHSEHLLRGGRYASCVHAGGLACSQKCLYWTNIRRYWLFLHFQWDASVYRTCHIRKICFSRYFTRFQKILKKNDVCGWRPLPGFLRKFLDPPLITSIKIFPRGQDSNLCGETPFDFESNALTTRPPRLLIVSVGTGVPSSVAPPPSIWISCCWSY